MKHVARGTQQTYRKLSAVKTGCMGHQRLLAPSAGEGLGHAVGVTYDWNFWNILTVLGGKNMDCLESFKEKGPGKTVPRVWHPELHTQDAREAEAQYSPSALPGLSGIAVVQS